MATLEFRLPDVGEGIDAGEIVSWSVAVGDEVREDQELVAIETDKAIVGIPSPATGTVTRLGAEPGDRLPVGDVLVVIETAGGAEAAGGGAETAGGNETDPAPGGELRDAPSVEASQPSSATSIAGAGRPLATPSTRRLARERGIDLSAVRGTGPQGRILREDLERATPVPGGVAMSGGATPPQPAVAASQVVPLRGVRRSIAQTLTRAWQTIPHVIDYREVDASELMRVRSLLKREAQANGDEALASAMTPTPLLVKMAVEALKRHPYVNASIDLERAEITLHSELNIGIAMATEAGLVVPVVHDAADKSVSEIALEIHRLATAAREGRLAPSDLSGGTFTVNNYGGLGIWLGTPIIKPPEVANLGIGALREQVVAVDGHPVVRPTIALAVSGDHRVLDGHTLAAFVTDFMRLVENPSLLLSGLR